MGVTFRAKRDPNRGSRFLHVNKHMRSLLGGVTLGSVFTCHSATANQVRLAFHTAAFWLMHGVRAAIPQTDPLATAEFATIRERLIKIGARVIEHIARIRIQLPTSCPEGPLFRAVALGIMPSAPRAAGTVRPAEPADEGRSTPKRVAW